MKVLAIDIGAGTQDILLYEDEGSPENCPKLVLPSPTLLYRQRVKALLGHRGDLFLDGSIIGGGGLISPLMAHLRSGYHVFMTAEAAFSLRNDLEEVKDKGIQIVEEAPSPFTGIQITLQEIDFTSLGRLLQPWDIDLSAVEVAAIAVQDHGVFPAGMSNRRFRLLRMKEALEADPHPNSLAFLPPEIPSSHLRMRSAAQASLRQLEQAQPLLMDTSLAAIAGCFLDPSVAAQSDRGLLCVNVGNGHTMAALIRQGKILGLFEHHTRLLQPEMLKRSLVRFADGDLADEEVFQGGGHGLFYLQSPPGFQELALVAVTGPRRGIIAETGLPYYYPAPFGDMMMTGPVGLVQAARERCGRKEETAEKPGGRRGTQGGTEEASKAS